MIDNKIRGYRRYQHFALNLASTCGCVHSDRGVLPRKFTFIWSYVGLSMALSLTLFMMNFVYKNSSNFKIVIKGIGITTIGFQLVVKISMFLSNRHEMIEVDDMLHESYEQEMERHEKIKEVMLSPRRTFSTLGYTHVLFTLGLLLMYTVPTYIYVFKQILTHQEMPVCRLPYHLEFMWTVSVGLSCYVHLIYEALATMCIWSVVGGVDITFGFYTYQMCSILRAMSYRLLNPLPGDKLQDILRTCAYKHNILLQCLMKLQNVLGPIALWMFISNAVTMCSLIYEAMPFSDMAATQFGYFIFFVFGKVLQTFNYAFYGTFLIKESENFCQAVYDCGWPDAISKQNDKVYIILIMMQKPMSLSMIGISTISMELFCAVLKTTMSYFFLLQSIEEK